MKIQIQWKLKNFPKQTSKNLVVQNIKRHEFAEWNLFACIPHEEFWSHEALFKVDLRFPKPPIFLPFSKSAGLTRGGDVGELYGELSAPKGGFGLSFRGMLYTGGGIGIISQNDRDFKRIISAFFCTGGILSWGGIVNIHANAKFPLTLFIVSLPQIHDKNSGNNRLTIFLLAVCTIWAIISLTIFF